MALAASLLSVESLGQLALGVPEAHALISPPQALKNRYFLVRRGESPVDLIRVDGEEVRGFFHSNPAFQYDYGMGLTTRGAEQMRQCARELEEELDFFGGWIYTTRFQRAQQSANVLREELDLLFTNYRVTYRNLDPRLMGAYDQHSLALRPQVWEKDREDGLWYPPPAPESMAPRESTESLFDIQRRCLENVTRYEAIYGGEDICLVSHLETMNVMQTVLLGLPLEGAHDLPFELAEPRCVDMTRWREGDDPMDHLVLTERARRRFGMEA